MTEDDGALDLEQVRKDNEAKDNKRNANLMKAGIGIGIGSAAIAAAMLYASSGRKKKDE